MIDNKLARDARDYGIYSAERLLQEHVYHIKHEEEDEGRERLEHILTDPPGIARAYK